MFESVRDDAGHGRSSDPARYSAGERRRITARAYASILHADLDSFYASVEQRDQPRLRGKPVLVGGGVVLAASYEAKARGVRTPMNIGQALRLCPDAIVVSPRMSAYAEASRSVFEIFADTTPVVEGISIDEAFLDVAGLRRIAGEPHIIATELRARVRRDVGLPISVGIAATKFLAKVASAVSKPDGLLLVAPEHELEFLHPLPVHRLWGVGPVTANALHAHGIERIGQLAAHSESGLRSIVGPAAARHLHALAWARDPRRVETGRRRRSIGAQRALARRPHPPAEIEAYLHGLTDRLARRLRAADRSCRTVVLRLRFGDFARATRSRTIPEATDHTETILRAARGLLAEAMPLIGERGLTLIGLSLTNLDNAATQQLALPFEHESPPALDTALDDLRSRFGSAAVTRAALLGRGEGLSVPLLPD
ncbi:DNA polymerase IV [Nocardia jinanensis]|uniref:DNA polymerase IV n=1 Tax=Nocardia jinanensis TaxID=382504 RepID=A0A917R5J2_9NOCA|nr:DNA polymerase IV [Nocardia jinanensis]GGK90816.1 DNA polymerase IV [Nocardia jinanensis]